MLNTKGDVILNQLEFLKNNLPFVLVRLSHFKTIKILHNSTPLSAIEIGKEYLLEKIIHPNHLTPLIAHIGSINASGKEFSFQLAEEYGLNGQLKCISHKLESEIESLWIPQESPLQNNANLLAAASHDIRSPINSIIGLVNLIEIMQANGELTPEELSKMVKMIKMSSNDAIDFTNDVLEMSSMESSSYSLNKEKVSMDAFIQHYINTHRLTALKKSIQIRYMVDHSINDATHIDKTKITRVFDNLFSNAIKFSHQGSNIDLTLQEKEEFLEVQVRDYGIGMPKEMLDSLFEKFGKSKRMGLLGEKSHGLGMSIVKQIMDLHHGKIAVDSKEGDGTLVRLIFKKE